MPCGRRSTPTAAGRACSSIAFHCRISRVAATEFFFALEFSSQGAPASLVEDLASQVFRYVGCEVDQVSGLTEALQQAVANGSSAGRRRCDVQFKASNGSLEILVSSNGGRIWQTSLTIP